MSASKTLQDELMRYKKSNLQAQQIAQSVINKISQQRVDSKERHEERFGDVLTPSTILDGWNEEYLLLIDQLNLIRSSLRNSLLKIVEYSQDVSIQATVDTSHLQSVIDNMKQQALLQENVFASIEDLNSQNYDTDAMVTLMACIRYAPYFDVNSLDNLILR